MHTQSKHTRECASRCAYLDARNETFALDPPHLKVYRKGGEKPSQSVSLTRRKNSARVLVSPDDPLTLSSGMRASCTPASGPPMLCLLLKAPGGGGKRGGSPSLLGSHPRKRARRRDQDRSFFLGSGCEDQDNTKAGPDLAPRPSRGRWSSPTGGRARRRTPPERRYPGPVGVC